MRKRGRVYGWGVNDFNKSVMLDGKSITEYYLWKSMLSRCYSPIFHRRNPTYKECEVEPFLLYFTNFYNFIRGLKGFGEVDEKGRPFQMDKDILIKGNKTYSVDTICFVPKEINSFLTNNSAVRGKLPVGVVYHKRGGVYQATFRLWGKTTYLGSFKTSEEAFSAYKFAKEDQAKVLAVKWKSRIDPRVYDALMSYEVGVDD